MTIEHRSASRRPLEIAVDTTRMPLPEHMSFSTAMRLGGDVALLVGYTDIPGAAMAAQVTSETVTVRAVPTHQFVMSLNSFQALRKQINELANALRQDGVALPEKD